ncbi:uncharacterized protein LOC132563464 [Ylistrum balloti]|uniref:uncharacterized protein LOC132563464 n=1 Tax=Ylistrum balloti TaxID=509963 RepID=UPI002905D99A|nr:uncharacterized protein LOC132563464 [Ylistrum balloti]
MGLANNVSTIDRIVSCFNNTTFLVKVFLLNLKPGKFMTRCVTRHADFMNITCPSRQVMLAPEIIAGYSERKTCVFNEQDCLGMTPSLEKEGKACSKQETCRINLRRILETLNPLPGQKEMCKGKPLTYVSIILPKCVPKYAFHAMCSGTNALPIYSRSGVIDSSYIQKRNTQCMRRFGSSADVIRLTLTFVHLQVGAKNRPKIVWTTENGRLRKRIFEDSSTFSETGSKFKIQWSPRNAGSTKEGFVISYKVELIKTKRFRLASNKFWQIRKPAVVQATLGNAMAYNKPNTYTMTCPPGKVIYSPDINVTSSRFPGCTGLSPYLIVQRNECYWRRNCTVNWNGPALITMTSSQRCFGRSGDNLEIGDYKCVKEGNIVNICDTVSSKLKSSGMIRSHSQYPWHYPRQNRKCRLRIKITKGTLLRLRVDDVDIDEEADTFIIKHIRRGRKVTVISNGNGRNILKTLQGGRVDITMSVKRHTKSGTGFILHYKRISKSRKKARRGLKYKRRSQGTSLIRV